MENKSKQCAFWLGVAASTLGAFSLGWWQKRRRFLPHLAIWRRALAQSRGGREAASLADRVQTRYEQLLGSRPHLDNRTLRMHLNLSILPGLALHLTLLVERGYRQVALEESEALFEAAFGRFLRLVAVSGRLPVFLSIPALGPHSAAAGIPIPGLGLENR